MKSFFKPAAIFTTFLASSVAQAQDHGAYAGRPSSLSLAGALLSDARLAMALIGHQAAMPLRTSDALPILLAAAVTALV